MTVVFCQCRNAEIVPRDMQKSVENWLLQSQTGFVCVDDLCGMAARKEACLQDWAAGEDTVVIACFERAVRSLFAMAGAELRADAVILNQRVFPASEIVERLQSVRPAAGEKTSMISDVSWVPWFPVLDSNRCVKCRQCLNFCLFGVYTAAGDGGVQVARPANCKTGCPACARVCPSAAIIFAKYTESPFNGDTVDETKLKQLRGSSDFKKWVAENLQKRLQMRNQMRSDEVKSHGG